MQFSGKTLENVRQHRDIKLVRTETRKCISHRNKNNMNNFDKNEDEDKKAKSKKSVS